MLLAPAVAVMNRLHYPQKFALISLLFALPLALLLYFFHSEINRGIASSSSELDGTQYLRALRELLDETVKHQIRSQQTAQSAPAASVAFNASLRALDDVEAKLGTALKTTSGHAAIQELARRLLERGPAPGVTDILVVHPNLPAKSVKELIALAKSKPGELNYAVNAAGSSSHRATELFKYMAGTNMVGVPYKGTAQGLNDVLGVRVQFMFSSAGSAAAHIKSRRLLALAVTGAKPFALNPDLPTVAESGLPGYESVSTYGIFAPAKTPEAVIKRLNQEIVQFLKTARAREQYLNVGVEVVASSPAEFATTIKSEMIRMRTLIKDAGIKSN